jgi:Tfp pilus assembly protein FimV
MIRLNWVWCAAVFCALMAGCSSPHYGRMHGTGDTYWDKAKSDMAALIKKHVADPERAKEANKVTEDIVAELRKSRDQTRQYHRQLYELNAKYDATPEEFTKILDEANHSRMQSASRILGLRFKLKNLLTAQEWNALSQDMMAYASRYGK